MRSKLHHFKEKRHRRIISLKNHPFIVPVVTFLALLLLAGGVFKLGGAKAIGPSDNHIVKLYVDGQEQTVPSKQATVGELIKHLNITLNPGDVIEPDQNTTITVDNFYVNIYRAHPVTIVDNGHKTVALSAASQPRTIAEQAGVTVYPEDNIGPSEPDTALSDGVVGEELVINRATSIALNLYGSPIDTRTQAKTVGDVIKEKGVKLAAGDNLTPAANTPVTANMAIFVTRQGTQITTVQETIPAPVQTISDPNLTYGTSVIRQKGSAGVRAVTYQITTTNGKETGRTAIQTVIVQPPVSRVVAVGTVPLSMSLQQWLLKLRTCESGGNYQDNTGNGYYGAYQFSISTWNTLNTGYSRADLAPASVQDQAIIANTNRSGGGLATQNPGCYIKQGLSAFPPANQ